MADNLAGQGSADKTELHSNFNVDYVIHYRAPEKESDEAEASFVTLIEALVGAGFETEVRPGRSNGSVLVFVRVASDQVLQTQVYRSRIYDWIYGIRLTAPSGQKGGDLAACFAAEPITEAERLRVVYLMLTKPKAEGGAAIVPPPAGGSGTDAASRAQWKYIIGVFPLHDRAFNRAWLKQWSTKYMLAAADIDAIRDKFGERVAFYFAFLQSYFAFLLFPAAFGFAAWLFIGQFSWFYALVNCLWSVVFFEYWKKKEVDLAVQWGTRGVSQLQMPRPEFRYDRQIRDPDTDELVKFYSPFRRLAHQLLQLPFAVACVLALGSLIAMCFAIEIFINEVYGGPFKQYLSFLPTVLLTVFMPVLTGLLTTVAERLTVLENYDTQDTHSAAYVQKIFVINFITSYLPVFLTAFVYIPFGKVLVPYLDVFQHAVNRIQGKSATVEQAPPINFQVNPDRLTTQVIYFTVTAQVVNFLLEVVVPYIKRRVFRKVEEISSSKDVTVEDAPEEAEFLERVRDEAELDVYDVTIDYREMVVQFGYLSLFSVVWPLTAGSFVVNNWVEARSDAMKIAIGSQRPIPWRADSIGPWLTSLGFLSWLGSLTSAAVVHLFRANPHGPAGSPTNIRGWALLLSILLAEHLYIVVQLVIRYAVDRVDSPGLRKERANRITMRKQALREFPSVLDTAPSAAAATLAKDAHLSSTEGHGTPETQFWLRQRSADETVQVGRKLIAESSESHKAAQRPEKEL